MATEISKRLFTVHEYHRMVDAGILSESDRVELIRGEIIRMSPPGPPHNGTILRASHYLFGIVGDRALVGIQGSIRLDLYSEPQPDIYLLRPREDFYTSRHAGPADIFLIIEVSDSRLRFDKTIKLELYAETGIPEYWIADLEHDCVITHSDLREGSYHMAREFKRGSTITPQLLPEFRIPVEMLLP